jgi:hypothetical protein
MSRLFSANHGHTDKETSDDLDKGHLHRGKRHAVEEPHVGNHRGLDKRLKYTERHQEGNMSGTVQEDKLASTLQECLTLFRSGLLQDINIDNLAFCKPFQEGNPHTPPPLQSLATANAHFLQYQDWITKLYLEAEKLDCGGFERCRSIKGELLGDLRNEWTKLEELKRSAWLTSQNAGPTMPPRPNSGPGFVQGIDTCERHSNPLRLCTLPTNFSDL